MQHPPNRGIAAVIVERQRRNRLAVGVTLSDDFALTGVQSRWSLFGIF